MLLRAYSRGRVISAAKEVCSVHLGRSEGTLIVTRWAQPRMARPKRIVLYFGEGQKEPQIVDGSGIVSLKGKGGRCERSVLGWLGERAGA